MNGAQLLVKCLESQGVGKIWGYPGGAIMPVYDALVDSPIRHFLTRHEQGAAFAAQGFARTTGQAGVCLATSGPGATNLLTGIADAYLDSIPIVAITGQVPAPLIGTDAFQEVDIFGMSLPVVKHSFLIDDVDLIPQVIHDAFETALSGRPGPVLIDFPKDISLAETSAQPLQATRNESIVYSADESRIELARELMARSRQPVLYAGGGVRQGDAVEELREFALRTQIPVVHTLHGLGGMPGDHEQFIGFLGMHGNKAANYAVQACDLLIAVGARFDDRVTGKLAEFAPDAAVIHLDIDPAELGKLRRPSVALCGEAKQILPELAGVKLDIEPWRKQCEQWKTEHAWRYDCPGERVFAPDFIRQLSRKSREQSDRETYICCDVGQHQMWVAQHFQFQHPRHHLTSGGLGTMGFGLPAAIGVQCAHPDANVIAVSGDGSIMMNIQELATLKRYGLPVKIVLLDNSALGMVRQWQELFFDNRESEVDLSDNPDFSKIAVAFGIESRQISKSEQVADAIDELLSCESPMLLHVLIDRATNVWPLVPPNANNNQMLDSADV